VQDSVTKKQRATSQKPEETGVPVTVEARKAEEGAARRVDDRELVRNAQRGFKGAFEELIFESVPSTPANDHVLVRVEQMP
jgi:hypothetical protein